MFDVTVAQVDKDTVRLNTTMSFDIEPRPEVAGRCRRDVEYIVKTEVEAYTGYSAEVIVSPSCKEAVIVVFLWWDPINLGNDIQELVVAAGYARDRIEKEAKE